MRMILALLVPPVLLASLLAPPATAQTGTQPVATSPATAPTAPRGVQARAAYLADAGTGAALWSRSPDVRRPIGSITKVMTALVVLREGDLDRQIRIKRSHLAIAAANDGSTAGLRPGDRIRARDLLNALMLPSGCDAADALADAYGPGRRAFVRKMNLTAQSLGLRRTRYAEASGLPSKTGRSTARDQVALGRYALRQPEFARIVKRSRYVLPAGDGHRRYVWRTTNHLLRQRPETLGIKTGYTRAAGYSLLFAARRNGRTLVGVVLDSSKTRNSARFKDAARLMSWGFGW
ncbi:D-alanyl-D-alanine carboxypeptidase family protein [Actinomadura hibisca]|uniref:D-alanyl-D-alanine carboxypeptidase family protein n=1 Tax=Actinomadura hibisca TaxID=68565 RepID=UPI00082DFDA7|nr:serine hydrolase [Actinomadura hibisca]